MENSFKFVLPLEKTSDSELRGIASALSVDRDDEKMSEKALNMMVDDIKKTGVNLFGNHEHNWENTLGRVKNASLVNDEVAVDIILDDASTNPKIPMLLNKLKRGIQLGLSVGGAVTDEKWDYNREIGKKIKVIDGVKLYEISVVGIPSNPDSLLSLPQLITKSRKELKGDEEEKEMEDEELKSEMEDEKIEDNTTKCCVFCKSKDIREVTGLDTNRNKYYQCMKCTQRFTFN